MNEQSYLGITAEYTSFWQESGSKFYGFLMPVKNEADFNAKRDHFKSLYPDATHICFGVILGKNRDYQRFSDDGEPKNSSGRPIIHTLLSATLTFVACFVVRYYGGKKLGIPGLISAYGKATELCVDQADKQWLTLKNTLHCTVDMSCSFLVFNELHTHKKVQFEYTENTFVIECDESMTENLVTQLKKIPTLAVSIIS